MKILYVIDKINIGGATDYLFLLALENMTESNVLVACKQNVRNFESIPLNISIVLMNGKSICDLFVQQRFDLIHWFKAEGSELFDDFCKQMIREDRLIPVVTTVCQYPREFKQRLTPNEIKYSQKIIFIDKHSLNKKLNNEILVQRKKMIYFGTKLSLDIQTTSSPHEYVLFGRGSSLNKCHPKLINWYHSIGIENKKFCIVGIGSNAEWLDVEVSKYRLNEFVEIIPHLPYNEWLDKVSSFDIFLYQLPLDSYSSIDGTMQAAMMYGKPIVYYGPEPPKELLIHGESGFIAKNKDEFVEYATMLANDAELRLKIGNNARERLQQYFDWQKTIESYKNIYLEILDLTPTIQRLSLIFYANYYYAQLVFKIRVFISKLFSKSFKKYIKIRVSKLNNLISI